MELHKRGVLEKYDVELIGARPAAIEVAEDRELFRQAMIAAGLEVAKSGTATPRCRSGSAPRRGSASRRSSVPRSRSAVRVAASRTTSTSSATS
jgi:carbamoylphosphate synthase large subunit